MDLENLPSELLYHITKFLNILGLIHLLKTNKIIENKLKNYHHILDDKKLKPYFCFVKYNQYIIDNIKIKHLNLSNCSHINDHMLWCLLEKNKPYLLYLNIRRCNHLSSKSLFKINTCNNLTSLEITSFRERKTICNLKNLKYFSISYCSYVDEMIENLNPELEYLKLHWCNITKHNFLLLKKFTKLHSLHIYGTTSLFYQHCIDSKDIKDVINKLKLKHITFSNGSHINDRLYNSFANFEYIRYLNISWSNVTNNFIKKISTDMVNLEDLNIEFCKNINNNSEIYFINYFYNLKYLNLTGTYICFKTKANIFKYRKYLKL